MDELKKGLNNISLYDVKAYVRKAQNVVYNYTEMEARVREATNNEPWGASSTLMQKIAAGTYNYREREEIIGMIFRRFTEKAANEWRQIYKALQLLEYLIKNGSERFVDDARSNLSLIQMLRSFHYIDSQGRDQGINVRTKSKTLSELLNNDSQLRAERKKARENSKKFQGVAGGASVSSNGDIHGDDYEEYGTYENRIFGDGGVYGQRFEESRAANKKYNFEEYDVEGDSTPSAQAGAAAQKRSQRKASNPNKPVPTKPSQPEVDLFSFDDAPTHSQQQQQQQPAQEDDDDFGDFQASTVQQSAPAPVNNLSSLYQQQSQQPQADSSFGDFTSFALAPNSSSTAPTSDYNTLSGPSPAVNQPKNDAFSSLFQSATSQSHFSPKPKPARPSAPATTTQTGASSQSNPAPSNGEINLLDL